MLSKFLSAASLGAVALAMPALAQSPDATPAYGAVRLSAGFAEDPTSIGVRAGGAIYAGNVSERCMGYITHQPSYRLTYQAGGLPLFLSAASDADGVLVVNGPDGEWYCNDDAEDEMMGLNPGLRFDRPASGDYNIWVGTLGSGSGYEPAMLHISEVGYVSRNDYSRGPRPGATPRAGRVELRAGFANDPRRMAVRAGGDLDASRGTGGQCWGMIGEAPDVHLDYRADSDERLYLSLQSDVDTTLVVQAPDGSWHCDDDEAGDLQPGVRIDEPQSGRYAIWAGRYSTGPEVDATLFLSNQGFLGGIDIPAELDYSAASRFGSIELAAGFAPDPYNVDLTGGGSVDVYEAIGENCRGFATTEPSFDLTYEAGDFDLYISSSSNGDGTLVVNAPDGSWWCDDDGAGDLNPGLRFDAPMSGRYDIWVGTYSENDSEPATLHFSELGFGGDFGHGAQLDGTLNPNFGTHAIEAGISADPTRFDVIPGGALAAEEAADQSCRGYVTEAPDFIIDYTASSQPLAVSARSNIDTTLVVQAPDGHWHCDDDSAGDRNPGLFMGRPQSGRYAVWVGTYSEGDAGEAELIIGTDRPHHSGH
ncbi:hypothetical protein [Maricaulis sp. CAU 1757]